MEERKVGVDAKSWYVLQVKDELYIHSLFTAKGGLLSEIEVKKVVAVEKLGCFDKLEIQNVSMI